MLSHKSTLMTYIEPPPLGRIHFIASKDFENVDFFQNITRQDSDYNFSNLQVWINDRLTDHVANSITAKADDDIKIVATRGVYPWFGHYTIADNSSQYDINYIKSIEEPLPLMYTSDSNPIKRFGCCFYGCTDLVNILPELFSNNTKVTDFRYCFYRCSSLTSIPAGLFENNTQVTSFYYCFNECSSLTSIPAGLFENNTKVTDFVRCFYECTSLTSIPAGLFDNNVNVTTFGDCFRNCTSLTSIPIGLFDKNINVTNFSYCFSDCSGLIVNVQIGSTASSVNARFFFFFSKEKGTVYCRAGSAAYTAFVGSYANVNVLTY